MAEITTRQDFKNYCLRRLGWPVIDINVDDDQVEEDTEDYGTTFSNNGNFSIIKL